MTDYAMKYSEKTMKEYVTYTMTGGSAKKSLPIIFCTAALTAIPIAALIAYFMLNNPALLVVVFCALFFDVLFGIIVVVMRNIYTKKMLAAFAAFDGLVCSVSSESIIIARDGAPHSVFGWDKIDEMHEGKNAFYLKTKDELLVILQKDNVLSGTARETAEIIAEKQRKSQ